MRAYLLIFALFLCAAVSGCSHAGDFGAFITTEVAKHGGHAVTKATLLALPVRWTIQSDTNGFQASVSGAPFANIAAVMQQAFGRPKISVAADVDGRPHQVWGATEIGAAIQLIGRPNGADIICVRGFPNIGEMFKSIKSP